MRIHSQLLAALTRPSRLLQQIAHGTRFIVMVQRRNPHNGVTNARLILTRFRESARATLRAEESITDIESFHLGFAGKVVRLSGGFVHDCVVRAFISLLESMLA